MEVGTARCGSRILIVDFLDVDDDYSIAVIVSGSGDDLVTTAQHVLANQLHRHVGIARFGEVAEPRAANESPFALRVEPADGFSIGNDRCEWRALFTARSSSTSALAAALLSSATATTTLSASALIAAAASVVTMFAVTLIALALPAAAFAATTAALLLAAHGLRVVLLL